MLAAALVLAAGAPLAADDYPRQPGVDVQNYAFHIALSDATDEITGSATVDVRFVQAGLTSFWLDLASPSHGKGMTVSAVTSNAAPARYTHSEDRLTIQLPRPSGAGQRASFTIQYRGVPAGGLNIGPNRFGERTFFSSNWPDLAHQWLPCVDHPHDKATSEFFITAPAAYQVVANGRLEEDTELAGGARLTHWKESVPIATWLDNIGVARFEVRRTGEAASVPLETWVFPQEPRGGAIFDQDTRLAVEFFSSQIGPYPYEKLADVEAVGVDGGMEHASEIFFGQGVLSGRQGLPFAERGSGASIVAHETAHQWFGDSVTESDWDDVWLSEGFATYFALLEVEHDYGRAAFGSALARARADLDRAEQREPNITVIATRPWKGVPSSVVYQKGAWTLHMLRGLMGDAKFWSGIREYYRRYRDANASTADFQKVMENAAGADLGWFFDQWLRRRGRPAIQGAWRYDPASREIVIDLMQTQPGAPYRLLIPVAIAPESAAPRMERVEMNANRQSFRIPSSASPRDVSLDPDSWVLMNASFSRQ